MQSNSVQWWSPGIYTSNSSLRPAGTHARAHGHTHTLISTHLRLTNHFGYTRLSMNPIHSSLIDLSNSDTWTWTLLLHLRRLHSPALPGDKAASRHSIWSLQGDGGKLRILGCKRRSPSLRNVAISFFLVFVSTIQPPHSHCELFIGSFNYC